MALASAGGEAEFVKMIGQLLQGWINGDWRMAWAAVGPFLVIVLLVAALRLFLPEVPEVKRRPRHR